MAPTSASRERPGTAAGVAYLDGRRLSRGLSAGIRSLLADQDRLNRINVFPVPDGDTGTNLALTMTAVQVALAEHSDRHLGRTLERVADAALDGARGNSGAILAQFLLGLGDACAGHARIDVLRFVDAVRTGSDYATDAMTHPREGTILTVIRAFADEIEALAGGGRDFARLLDGGLARARRALDATRDQLEELTRANVVDAGALGFVDLLEGVTAFLRHGSARADTADEVVAEVEEAFPEFTGQLEIEHRYCTECVVTGDVVDRRGLREALANLGSSLVVAGTHRKTRVHIHADEPEQVFAAAAAFGAISSRKADDMRQQRETAAGAAGRVAVVVDSAGDLPDSELERLGIHLVPLRIHFGEASYLDKVSLSNDEFYAELARNPEHPKTSQPPPGDFRRLYQFLASHHPGVVSIHISAQVSGTFRAATTAADRVSRDGGKIHAIDSRNASLGQGLIALEAAELARAGHGLEEITLRLEDSIARTRAWGLLGDVSYAVRGGRVPRYRKVVADVLRLTPIIRTYPDGRIASGGALSGRRELVRRFAHRVAAQARPGRSYRLAVAHASDPERGRRLLRSLRELIPAVGAHYLTELGSALGVHGGPGTLVVALQEIGTSADPD
jgi:DegV family protein with EDD domain